MKNLKEVLSRYIVPRLIVDILFFYILLMFLGLVIADVAFDTQFVLGAIANYLMLVFAFIINDIEDKDDDAKTVYKPQSLVENIKMMVGLVVKEKDLPEGNPEKSNALPGKRFENPFSVGRMTVMQGYAILVIIALVALVLSASISMAVLGIAVLNIILGVLYSWRKVRLKSVAVLDLISHALLLATLQVAYFAVYPNALHDGMTVFALLLVFLTSVAGDLRNELRDYKVDAETGVRNTIMLIGPDKADKLSRVIHIVTTVLLVLIVVSRLLS